LYKYGTTEFVKPDLSGNGMVDGYDLEIINELLDQEGTVNLDDLGGNGITINSSLVKKTSTIARAFLKSDIRGNFNWHFTNGDDLSKGLVISDDGSVSVNKVNRDSNVDFAVGGTVSVTSAVQISGCGSPKSSGLSVGNNSYFYTDFCSINNDGDDNKLLENTLHVYSKGNVQISSGEQSNAGIFISNDGDVGMGTKNPQAKLDVDGSIRLRPVDVNQTNLDCDSSVVGRMQLSEFYLASNINNIFSSLFICMHTNTSEYNWVPIVQYNFTRGSDSQVYYYISPMPAEMESNFEFQEDEVSGST